LKLPFSTFRSTGPKAGAKESIYAGFETAVGRFSFTGCLHIPFSGFGTAACTLWFYTASLALLCIRFVTAVRHLWLQRSACPTLQRVFALQLGTIGSAGHTCPTMGQAFEPATFGSTNPYLLSLVKHLFSLSKLPWPHLFLQSTTCPPAANAVTMQVGSSSCLPEPPPEPPPNKGVGGIEALAHL
jgi:hypothetical protein